MDQNVDQMVTENMKFAEMIIQGKCQVNQWPGELQYFRSKIIVQVSDIDIFLNRMDIIEYERRLKMGFRLTETFR